eukprot:g53323.t1
MPKCAARTLTGRRCQRKDFLEPDPTDERGERMLCTHHRSNAKPRHEEGCWEEFGGTVLIVVLFVALTLKWWLRDLLYEMLTQKGWQHVKLFFRTLAPGQKQHAVTGFTQDERRSCKKARTLSISCDCLYLFSLAKMLENHQYLGAGICMSSAQPGWACQPWQKLTDLPPPPPPILVPTGFENLHPNLHPFLGLSQDVFKIFQDQSGFIRNEEQKLV